MENLVTENEFIELKVLRGLKTLEKTLSKSNTRIVEQVDCNNKIGKRFIRYIIKANGLISNNRTHNIDICNDLQIWFETFENSKSYLYTFKTKEELNAWVTKHIENKIVNLTK